MTENRKTVAIIGAGIVGVSTAIWLQRDGHDVILIDGTGVGGGDEPRQWRRSGVLFDRTGHGSRPFEESAANAA